MPKQVQLPSGDIGQFPDSMSDTQIEAVLQKQFPAPKPSLNTRLTSPNSPQYAKNHPVLSALSDFGGGALNTGEQILSHPIRSAEGTIQTLDDVYNADPGTKNPTPATHDARARLKQQWDFARTHPAYSLGGLAGGVVAGEGIGKMAEGASEIPDAVRNRASNVGATPREVGNLVKKTRDANEVAAAKARESNAAQDAARKTELREHFDKVQAAKENAKASSEQASRKTAIDRGVEQRDVAFQNDLKQTAENVRQQAGAKYDAVREATKGQTIPSFDLASAVKDAESKIQGSSENLKIFRDILSKHPEGEPDSIPYQGAQIPKGHPLYQVLTEQGAGGASTPATFSDLQGYYSELGSQLAKGTLPADVYLATQSLQESIGNLMQQMADRSGVGSQLQDARGFYRNYMQTFRDHKSPLFKASKATERGDAIAELAGMDKTGIEALARYNPELARRANTLRGLKAEAATLPKKSSEQKSVPKIAPKPERVVPEAKKINLGDIEELKRKRAASAANHVRHWGVYLGFVWPAIEAVRTVTRGEMPDLASTAASMIATPLAADAVARIIESPKMLKLLTRATPADIAAVPAELRGDLPVIAKAARARGIQLSPAFAAMGGVSSVYHPTLSPQSPVQP